MWYETMVYIFVDIGMSLKNYTSTNINMKWGNSSYTQNKKVWVWVLAFVSKQAETGTKPIVQQLF